MVPFIPILWHGTASASLLTTLMDSSESLDMRTKFFGTLLAKACLFQAIFLVGAGDCKGKQALEVTQPAQVPRKESGRIPKVPTVESMLRPDGAVEGFLSRTPSESAFANASNLTNYSKRLSGEESQSIGVVAGWTAPEFYTRPLYFEQVNLERYETGVPAWTRPAISYAQFLTTIPLLPCKVVTNGPRKRVYTIGHYSK